MNALDELLAATAPVADPAPVTLRHGRAALDAAIATAQAGVPSPLGTRARRRPGIWLGIACTAAASAAAAGVIVAVTSSRPEGTSAGSGTQKTATGSGTQKATAGSGTQKTAATVLDAAAVAAGVQPGDWPDAAYWHVTAVYERNGKTYHREIWIARHGNGVLKDNGVSPGLLNIGPASFEGLTWAQLYALPTDPAKLAAVLQGKFTSRFPSASASPGAVTQDAELYTVVGDLLRESPAPPALREALFKVAASIPGVVLKGDYTDSLGQTGTAVQRDGETLVTDPATGALIADVSGDPGVPSSCGTSNQAEPVQAHCTGGGLEYAYVSQGPAASAP